MKARKLNAALEQGRAAAEAHEEALARAYEQALKQIGRFAARRFTAAATPHLTAAAPTAESAMLAVYPTPEQAQALAQPNGEPPEILHVTLAYLGEVDPDQAEQAAAVAREVAGAFPEPELEGVVGGIAAFGSETGMLAELARIAGLVAPDGGYGTTLWNREEATVLWIPADWTTVEEQEAAAAAFFSVPGVEAVEVAEAETPAPQGDEWEPVWAAGRALVEAVYPSIVLPDVPGLAELRQAVCEALTAAGMPYAENHGWNAHLTISYGPEPVPPPAALLGLPLTFANLSVAQGDVARDFPLGAPALTAAGPPDWSPPHGDEVVDPDEVISRLRTKSDRVRRAAIEAAASPALDAAGLDWDVSNPFVKGVLEKTGAEIVGIGDTTRLNVLRIIDKAYEEGLTIPDTAKAIREGMGAAAGSRAVVIARTEMASLTNGGELAATRIVAAETGITYWKRWLTAPGAEHPRHEDYDGLDGQTVALDDLFAVGAAKLSYPGDPDGPPEESIQCRCSMIFVESPAAEIEGPELEPAPADIVSDLASTELPPIEGRSAETLASSVIGRAKILEPTVTKIIRGAVEPRGGVMEGLEFRLKSQKSMRRKIIDVAHETSVSGRLTPSQLAAAAKAMKDGLRFTAVYGPRDFVPKMQATLESLGRAGLKPVRIRHSWAPGSDYVGTNVILRAPNGYEFELQFHTPESLASKEKFHPLYERWRALDPESYEAKQLQQKMVALRDSIYRPLGVREWEWRPPIGPTSPDPLTGKPLAPPPAPAVKPLAAEAILNLPTEDLWAKLAEYGKFENAARAEIADAAQAPIIEELWQREREQAATFEGRRRNLSFADVNGDQQVHSHFSDGHGTIEELAAEAIKRGQTRIVISDHSHLLTAADIRAQHKIIDDLNADFRARGVDFQVVKGIEANILSDGRLDTADDILVRFDVVNAAIHAPIQAEGGQLALFAETNTERLLRAMDNPSVKVLVHPHSVDADWTAIAKKAAEKGVALEINGRDLLRNGRQEAAAAMIRAAKEHGAKLVIGSDAHTPTDLIDSLYAVRFASDHGVTKDDLVEFGRAGAFKTIEGLTPTESVNLKIASLDSTAKADVQAALETLGQHLRVPAPSTEKVRVHIRGDLGGHEGFFRPQVKRDSAQAVRLGEEGKAPMIGIRRLADDRYEAFVHEYGHYLDWSMMGKGKTFRTGSEPLGPGELADWWNAIQASEQYKKLNGAALSGEGFVVQVDDLPVNRSFLEYLTSPWELWARSFTQWLALRDPRLAETVQARRVLLTQGGKVQNRRLFYWSDEDFRPIAAAVDAYFKEKRWLIQSPGASG